MTWTEPFVNLCLSMFYTAGVKHVWHHRVGDQESGRKWPIRACTQKAEKSAHYLIDSYVYKYIQRCAQDTRRYFECLLILCLLQMFSTFSNLDLLNHQWAVFYQWLSSQVFWRAMNHFLKRLNWLNYTWQLKSYMFWTRRDCFFTFIRQLQLTRERFKVF